jgi:hypothetical protein
MTDEMSTAPATFDRNLPTWSRCAYFARQAATLKRYDLHANSRGSVAEGNRVREG